MKQHKSSIIVLSLANQIIGGLAKASEFQTCYTTKGEVSLDTFRCNNHTTGHSSCCMAGEVCWSNGVCHGKTHGIEDWLRESCTDHSWSDTACFDVCPDLGEFAAGVRPCGGIDKSNLYCCDNGSSGIGSFACCNDQNQTFHYNNITTLPTIIATIPLDDTVPTSSSIVGSTSPESTSTRSTSTSVISSVGSGNSGGSSNSTAIGVGLGVGLPAAAAIFAGVGFMIWRTKRNQRISEQKPQASSYLAAPHDGTPERHIVTNPQELSSDYNARELPA